MTIKYRVWDKKAKEMNTVWSINFVGGNVETGKKKIDFDDAQLMQYTGFEDSEGTEIYEGDIIELVFVNDELIVAVMNKRIKEEDVNKDDLKEVERYEVYYNSKHGCYCIANLDPEIRKREKVNWLDDSDMLSEWNKGAKVIGNIYEI